MDSDESLQPSFTTIGHWTIDDLLVISADQVTYHDLLVTY